jgi:hypothetical protein
MSEESFFLGESFFLDASGGLPFKLAFAIEAKGIVS